MEIPDAFFMIVVDEQYQDDDYMLGVLAFIFQHEVSGTRPSLQESLSTVDEIEAQTGLDFLHELPDELEDKVEGQSAEGLW